MTNNAKGYEVIGVDELTVPRTIATLQQGDGTVFYQNGMGRTYLRGEVIDPDKVADDWKIALDEGEDNSLYGHLVNKLRLVSDEPHEDIAGRLGLPFDGYDDMDAESIVRAMSVLPSATIQRIKTYEATRGADARSEIVDYNIGFGEHPDDRQLAQPQEVEVDPTKAAGRITTRNVPEDGPVQRGEGFTGTGDPQKAYGIEAEAAEGDEDAAAEAGAPARGNLAATRAKSRSGRRQRAAKPAKGTGEGASSIEQTNKNPTGTSGK